MIKAEGQWLQRNDQTGLDYCPYHVYTIDTPYAVNNLVQHQQESLQGIFSDHILLVMTIRHIIIITVRLTVRQLNFTFTGIQEWETK